MPNKKIIIDNQETNYSVTEEGKVFNDRTGKELKGTYASNEYQRVQLTINGKPKSLLVHRLVAEAFCDNPNKYDIVDHIDRDKHNNRAENLRWVTGKENSENVIKTKTRTPNQKYNGDFSEGNWKTVFGHPNYKIDDRGTVVNLKNKNIMGLAKRNGYIRTNIDGSLYSNHILVWEAFHNQKVPEGKVIDHIDGNRSNNFIENLRLVDNSSNMKNSYNHGHKGQVGIKQYSLDGEFIKEYSSIREAAKTLGLNEIAIKDASNRHGTSGNFYWIRSEEDIGIQKIINNWVPDGYTIIKDYPTYCINKEGKVYNKRSKEVPIKYRTDGEPFIIIKGKRINISEIKP